MPDRARVKRLAVRGLALVAAAVAGCVIVACSNGPQAVPTPAAAWNHMDAEQATSLLERYNDRVEGLERLWARATVVYEGSDSEGDRLREQGEGHLQVRRPRDVALTIGKLGDTRLYFGSNEERYWWIDTVDRDRKIAYVGDHEHMTPEKIRRLGLPLRPLGLIELLGISALDARNIESALQSDPDAGDAAPTQRLTMIKPGGTRVLFEFEGEDAIRMAEPSRIVIASPAAPRIHADLSRYQTAFVGRNTNLRPRLATRFIVRGRAFDGEFRLSLYDPENRPIRDVAFQPQRLLDAYGVERVIDLDKRAADARNADPVHRADRARDAVAGG